MSCDELSELDAKMWERLKPIAIQAMEAKNCIRADSSDFAYYDGAQDALEELIRFAKMSRNRNPVKLAEYILIRVGILRDRLETRFLDAMLKEDTP